MERARLDQIFTSTERIRWIIALLFLLSLGQGRAAAEEEWGSSDYGWFLAGGASAFVLHESAHALVAKSFGFDVRLESRRKPIPFIVVRYDLISIKDESGQIQYTDENGQPVSHGAEKRYATASAGINSQNISSEIILTLYPNLREEPRPFLKGVLAFDVLTSIGYALVGRKDPDGDLRGMSEALGVDDKLVGTLVFLPAALDAYRYFYPESRWAPWASRGAKGYLLGLSFRW
ncbi:MAG: hypothetical protein EPO39_14105 [Candidatus Manganitrophaceae bacterium]|nr:MAG: hypothetical protein EPO39_14105 [Candidatus Manganitrophaceae bacterium]